MRFAIASLSLVAGAAMLWGCGDPHSYSGGGREINHIGSQTSGGDGGAEGGGTQTTNPPPVVDSGGPPGNG